MKKLLSTACALFMCANITTCTSNDNSDKTTLTVFAAASMTETMEQIADIYKQDNQNIDIEFNFDSSGTLKTQIEQGAVCDIFISAAQKQMDELGEDFVNTDSRVDLLENKVVMIVPENSDSDITSFEDVKSVNLISLGNSDVPVGQYSEQIFKSLGLWDELNNGDKISFASNVKEVVSQVASASVDCGVVYATDVTKDSKVKIVADAPENSCEPAIYPAAVLKTSENQTEAQKFLDFLSQDECKDIFTKAGFTPLT